MILKLTVFGSHGVTGPLVAKQVEVERKYAAGEQHPSRQKAGIATAKLQNNKNATQTYARLVCISL